MHYPTLPVGERKSGSLLVIAVVAAVLTLCGFAYAQDLSDYEYEPDEGFHQEEWYDPSDWFDTGEGVDYEADWDDYYYGYDIDDEWVYVDEYERRYNFWNYDPYYYEFYTEDWWDDHIFDENERD